MDEVIVCRCGKKVTLHDIELGKKYDCPDPICNTTITVTKMPSWSVTVTRGSSGGSDNAFSNLRGRWPF